VTTGEAAEQLAALLNAMQADGVFVQIVPEPGSQGHMLKLEQPVGDGYERDDVMWTYGSEHSPFGIRWLVAPK
jgi:hypothetical protein